MHFKMGQRVNSHFFKRKRRMVYLRGAAEVLSAVLSDSATQSNLNASNFLTVKDNIIFNPIFGMLSSRAIQNIPDMLDYL